MVLDLDKNIVEPTDLALKKARIGGFAYLYSPPSFVQFVMHFRDCAIIIWRGVLKLAK